MRDQLDVFHLALPAYDLESTEGFYVDSLGCKLARRYEDRITLDFFGDQLVCHLIEPPSGERQPPVKSSNIRSICRCSMSKELRGRTSPLCDLSCGSRFAIRISPLLEDAPPRSIRPGRD